MKTTIDKAGRVVIPKTLRDLAGLASGGEVEITLDGAALRIEGTTSLLVESGGVLLLPPTGQPVTADEIREQRLGDQR